MIEPDFEKAQKEAEKILRENYITQAPVPVEELVEYEGLGLIRTKFDNGDVAGVINLETKYLLVNSADSERRQRFTIAHELGHWLLHEELMYSNRNLAVLFRNPIGEEQDAFEKEANFFAANLLVPNNMLADAVKMHQDNNVLANLFNVSISVIGFRRKFLGI